MTRDGATAGNLLTSSTHIALFRHRSFGIATLAALRLDIDPDPFLRVRGLRIQLEQRSRVELDRRISRERPEHRLKPRHPRWIQRQRDPATSLVRSVRVGE